MTYTSKSGSVSRSLHFAFENSDGTKPCDDDVKKTKMVLSRKRKSFSKEIGMIFS